MRRYVYLLSAVTLVLSACGPEAGEQALVAEQGPVGEASQASLVFVPLPILVPVSQVYVPAQPAVMDLTTARWPARFFPSTVRSAYTVYYTFYNSLTRTTTFYAFGYDVKSYKTVFMVRGSGTQRSAFKSEIDADLQLLDSEAASGLITGYEGGRQIDVPTPPSPTPNVDDMAVSAWEESKAQYMVDVPQPLVYMPAGMIYQLQP